MRMFSESKKELQRKYHSFEALSFFVRFSSFFVLFFAARARDFLSGIRAGVFAARGRHFLYMPAALAGFELLEGFNGRPIQHITFIRETGTVTGAIPRFFRIIPCQAAAHMGTGRIDHMYAAYGIAVCTGFFPFNKSD